MNDKQLRELDAYLAEHAMGWKRVWTLSQIESGQFFVHHEDGVIVPVGRTGIEKFNPTTNPADAMAVLKKCAEKLEGDPNAISIYCFGTKWRVCQKIFEYTEAETLELAICKFAKEKVFK